MTTVARAFPPTADSVGLARRFAVKVLREQGAGAAEDDVRTVVSELATNAVLHARTAFTLRVRVTAAEVQVAVTDGSPTLPRLSRYRGSDSSTGRGLQIVARLSTDWGVTPHDAGKTTWCDLPVRPGRGRADDGAAELDEPDLDALMARFSDPDDAAPVVLRRAGEQGRWAA